MIGEVLGEGSGFAVNEDGVASSGDELGELEEAEESDMLLWRGLGFWMVMGAVGDMIWLSLISVVCEGGKQG